MTTIKRIVCLANSRKTGGRCIAGREFDAGRVSAWVRPVSARENDAVSEHERQYEDGSDPKVLDIIDVPMIDARPKTYQQENWLIDEQYWVRRGKVPWSDLSKFEDRPAPLWINGYSTYNGMNDRIPLAEASNLRSSLRLLRLPDVELDVYAPGADFGNPLRRVQAKFNYQNDSYWLWVTDPVIERTYLGKANGAHRLGECYLTVSLGESKDDYSYKLVAAIISR